MKVRYGSGKTKYGPGVEILLTGEEVARAISAYLVARDVFISGARTIMVNGDLCDFGRVYVDPAGFVIRKGEKFTGRGEAGEARPMDDPWVIRKSGYYYRPNRSGYTGHLSEAGHYTEAEAKAEANVEPRIMTAIRLADVINSEEAPTNG